MVGTLSVIDNERTQHSLAQRSQITTTLHLTFLLFAFHSSVVPCVGHCITRRHHRTLQQNVLSPCGYSETDNAHKDHLRPHRSEGAATCLPVHQPDDRTGSYTAVHAEWGITGIVLLPRIDGQPTDWLEHPSSVVQLDRYSQVPWCDDYPGPNQLR